MKESKSFFNFIVDGVSRLVKCCQVVVYALISRAQVLLFTTGIRLSALLVPLFTYFFMFDHDGDPLLEILLHADSAPLEQVLNPFNFCFEVLQLVVIALVKLLVLEDLYL